MPTEVKPLTDLNKAVPFQGGCNTVLEPDLLPFGTYSMVQNMRQVHPGMQQRKGSIAQHTTPDGGNGVVTLFQFTKGRVDEKHLYAQMSDGDVLEATSAPPLITTGVFGPEVFSGSAGQIPASWGVINDQMLFANGVDQVQIYPGLDSYVDQVVVHKGSGTIPIIPTLGVDYTEQATDGLTTTAVILDSLSTLAAYHCVFVRVPVSATSLKWTVSLANGTAAVAQVKYWNGAWTGVSGFSDGTAVAGAAFAKSGSMSWTKPTDEIPHYMYNEAGIWLQISLSSGALDSEVEVTSVQYNAPWQNMINLWDGYPVDISEAQFYDASATTHYTYGSVNIDVGSATISDILNVSCATNVCGIYVDPGVTPNTTAATTISDVKYWNGTALASVSGLVDGTSGFSKPGWITFTKPASQPRQYNNSGYYAHWFQLITDKTLSLTVKLAVRYMPVFDIAESGTEAICCAVWKDRALYVWKRFPVDIAVSAKSRPQILNGLDFTYLERPGDGRLNNVVAMRKFYNDLMVWQMEKGPSGGCLTIYEGYSPATFGKFVVSTKYGTFSDKTVCVVEGVRLGENKVEDRPISVGFFLSHAGVCKSDGRSVVLVSDDIANFFDPTKAECIRNGYEDKMWLEYDATFRVLRIGLVSGNSATDCNIFPVYDIKDKTWSFDVLAQPFSCIADVEADSGDVTVLQLAGGQDDGTVYQTNITDDDVDTAIDSFAMMELDGSGATLDLRELIIRTKSGQGALVVTPYVDGVAQPSKTIP